MYDDILGRMRQSIIDGARQQAAELAEQGLATGLQPLRAINDGYMPGMTWVGEQFGARALFLPDMMMAAEAMKAALRVLEPAMQQQNVAQKARGTVVLGTVKGDIHEIGKNLVATLLTAHGFRVFDLGTNVPAARFAEAAAEHAADVVGASALLTTTMMAQRAVVEAVDAAGLRPRTRVIVGGAPVTQRWADEIGADGYAADAMRAMDLVSRLLDRAAVAGGGA